MRRNVTPWLWLVLAGTLVSPVGMRVGAAEKKGRPAGFPANEMQLLTQMKHEGTNVGSLYALGDVCHDAGAAGDKEAVVRAEAYLRQLLTLEPTNAMATALLGSIYTMKGRDAFWPTTQLRLVGEGNEMMDRAVSMAPEDVRTRLTRALNNAHMPEFLGRSELVVKDLSWLWGKWEKDPTLFTVNQRQELALHWGRRLKKQDRHGEARKVWETGKDFDPESKVAKEIGVELAKMH